MATRLKKIMKPFLKQKCSESYQAGYKKGLEDGWQKKLMGYEREIETLHTLLDEQHREIHRLRETATHLALRCKTSI